MNVQAATATMAHEVKQPLAVISLKGEAAQRLLNNAPPDIEQVRLALVSIVDNTHRAGQIVNSTRALLGRTKKGQDAIHVNKLALQVLDLLQEQLKAQDVLVRVELTTGLPLIMGDHSQLQEVVINLLQNAIEAMSAVKKGHKLLRLRTKRHGERSVVVEVEDTGPGIDPTGLNSIFDAFFTTKPKGMGLGLAISRMIVERHGGRLAVASDGTNGALFQAILPTHEP
jgi:signal transduction histidine kinase